jgi:dTDP-4-amino-4,6-dideoxygalactose transaminase
VRVASQVPPLVPFVDLPRQHRALRDELLQVMEEALASAAFIGGAAVERFEREFATYVGAADAVGVSNGTDALRLALQAVGVQPGQSVITVPNTFVATAAAISQAGARPAFADIDPDTCLMDPNRLEDFLKRRFASGPKEGRPAAVVPVHLYGHCADLDAILPLAAKYGLKVIEDAAQAHGATCRGRAAGSMGDAGCFSFYPGKNLGACGDAGAVTVREAAVAARLRMLRDHGQRQKYVHEIEGYNNRLDAIQAGFLRVKLRRLDGWNEARRQVAACYDAAFAPLPAVRCVRSTPGNQSVYHLYVIHVAHRDVLLAGLRERGIIGGLHYPIPLHLQECYHRLGHRQGDFPCAEWSAAHLLSLPMYPEMVSDQVAAVIDAVKGLASSQPPLPAPPARMGRAA